MKRRLPVLIAALAIAPALACSGTMSGDQLDQGGGKPRDGAPPGKDHNGGKKDGPQTNKDKGKQDKGKPQVNPLKSVTCWGYQIGEVENKGAVAKLVASPYELLVLEPTNTTKAAPSFNSKGMVQQLHATKAKSGRKRIVLAYINVGQAENWRYYWKSNWKEPKQGTPGTPDFMLTIDPDGWDNNYPVAFWDQRWKAILLTNSNSMIRRAINDGYDGVYMDWVEAFSDTHVIKKAKQVGKNPAEEMIKLIGEIRTQARKYKPGFLVVPQNAPDLAQGRAHYFKVIDAIAQEQVYYDGDADTEWDDEDACDQKMPTSGSHSTPWYENQLKAYQNAGLPVFNVEYACDKSKVNLAYSKSAKKGFKTYATRRPLSQLIATPPPGCK